MLRMLVRLQKHYGLRFLQTLHGLWNILDAKVYFAIRTQQYQIPLSLKVLHSRYTVRVCVRKR